MRVVTFASFALAVFPFVTNAWTMKAGMSDSQGRCRIPPSASAPLSRRDALCIGSIPAVTLGFAASGLILQYPRRTEAAFPFGGDGDVAGQLDDVARARQKVEEVLSGLKSKQLKGGKDDSATVVRYMDAHYKPLQEKMVTLAPKMKVGDEEKQKRLETLPLLLKGHLFELAAAARTGVAAEQLQEMEEVAESVDEFLALARESGRYQVRDYLGPAPEFDVKREYGPFACEFWGKVRLPESNVCVWPDEVEKK